MSQYLNEFLFRGRAESDARPPEWHVVISEPDDVDGFGQPRAGSNTGAITPERADKEFGWPLSRVMASINGAALAEADSLRAANAFLTDERAKQDGRIAELIAAKAAAEDALAAAVGAAEAKARADEADAMTREEERKQREAQTEALEAERATLAADLGTARDEGGRLRSQVENLAGLLQAAEAALKDASAPA